MLIRDKNAAKKREILNWKAKNIQSYIKKIEAEASKRIKELDDK